MNTSPLLDRYRVLHSRDAEQTRSFLEGKGYCFDLPPRHARLLRTRINSVYMPSLYIGYIDYGSLPVTLSPSVARDDYLVQLPMRGHLAASIGSESIDGSSARAVIASPEAERCRFVSSADSARLQLALSQAALSRQLAGLLGEPATAPLRFVPAMDLSTGHGRLLAQHVLMAVASFDEADPVLLNPLAASAFEQFIMTALLLSHPHSYSDALQRLQKSIAPRDVKRAVDFIEAHLRQPITVGDLVQATGVAGRTLFMHFKEFKGVSPMRYLRRARLRQVRQDLLQAGAETTVTEVAISTGFTHMGRFSAAYRRCFGESPSQTLSRRRGRA
jgi:AraC-like DNA-binding protein